MGLTYLDSSVLIDAMVSGGPNGDAARAAIESAGAETLATSPLVDLECLVRPIREGNRSRIDSIRETLSRFTHLKIAPRTFALAAHMRAVHGLKTPDALHLATASLGECDEFWTTDSRLLRAMPGFTVNPYQDR